jgi:Protein of unknown function (DUF2637)
VSGGVDRAIRLSTAAAVLGVAGIAAYVSYQHAFEVVRAHGESGLTARLEPATIDGLVYSSSMVILYAARHRLPVLGLARWLLALGILATLAANVAHGWPAGPVGAVVAAWPAASLVGSYELLLWLIRTAAASGPAREPVADHGTESADHPPDLRLVPALGQSPAGNLDVPDSYATTGPPAASVTKVDQATGPEWPGADRPNQLSGQATASRVTLNGSGMASGGKDENVDAAAVAAYRASLKLGRPLSERKLAAMFGKTSRRWARNRMAEARQAWVPATTQSQ